jgi:tetratricopeptide (TPR) repeat protein/class 3 adenylate cyclase
MPKPDRIGRTWLSSVVFMDIVSYSSRSVDEQMRWKLQFNKYLTAAIKDVPAEERVVLDTGDGAAICFLGAPEAAMFAALDMWHALISGERETPGGPSVRIGINLGPIKLVKDINGAWNAIGDGINDGQRVMSFATGNEILVSQSFYDIISRISDGYKEFFQWKGVARDRHVREHRVFTLLPPESSRQASVRASAAYKRTAVSAPAAESAARKGNRWPMAIAVAAAVAAIAGGTWYFLRPAPASVSEAILTAASNKDGASLPAMNAPAADAGQPEDTAPAAESPMPAKESKKDSAGSKRRPIPVAAKEAYGRASQLLHDLKFTEAVPYYDAAIKANPDYLNAYVGRADALRRLGKYDQSVADCNKAMQINALDARGRNCRGVAYVLMSKFAEAVSDFNEAIRLNPDFGSAYIGRGDAYIGLRDYHKAVDDFTAAIQRRPKDGGAFLRRAGAYASLGAYKKAIQDYDESLSLMPDNPRAYSGRAAAEEALGNKAAAEADRRHAREPAK